MYNSIKKIYDKTDRAIFSMAAAYLMDIGWNETKQITDEDIETRVEGNGLMTKEFCQDLVRVARDIAQACTSVEFIQLCQVEKLYDTKGLPKKKVRY